MWRIDPALHRETDVAERLTSAWTMAYNAGDPKALLALYADDAALSTVQEGTINGKPAIETFWVGDFGATKPSSTLTLTDVYVVGELAHLEGDYKVADSGKITQGRYIQLWMRDAKWLAHSPRDVVAVNAGLARSRSRAEPRRPRHGDGVAVGVTEIEDGSF